MEMRVTVFLFAVALKYARLPENAAIIRLAPNKLLPCQANMKNRLMELNLLMDRLKQSVVVMPD